MSSNNVTCTPDISMHYFRREFRAKFIRQSYNHQRPRFCGLGILGKPKTNRPILRLDCRQRLGRVRSFQIQTHKLWGFVKLKLIIKHQYLPSEADHHKPAWLWNGCLFCTHVLQPLATFFKICFSSSFLVTLLWKGFSFNEHKWYRKWTWRLTTT